MDPARDGRDERGRMSVTAHLRKHDHWTFLVGFALVGANVVVHSRLISAAALAFLAVAMLYDAAEHLSAVGD